MANSLFGNEDQPWMYPINKVLKDPIEGYYIDLNKDPGGPGGNDPRLMIDIDAVESGDLITGDTLYRGALWEVTFVDEPSNIIYVKPTNNNPLKTGVGAGGKPITEYDLRVMSGDAEKERVDYILDRIQNGLITDYNDVAYILLGTVPTRFGANGAEGGWYTCTDWHSRGHRQGLSSTEIMMRDAATLQKLGFEVPPKALSGELNPSSWNDLMSGQAGKGDEDTQLIGEDWTDIDALTSFILNQTIPQFKKRNADALLELSRPFPREAWDAIQWPSSKDDSPEAKELRRDAQRKQDILREQWRRGLFARPDLLRVVHDVALELFYVQHPVDLAPDFDPYWYTKEKFIEFASDLGWVDVLRLYINTKDATNRRYTVSGLFKNDDLATVLELLEKETHPEAIYAILVNLEKYDKELFYQQLDLHYSRLLNIASGSDYHADQLLNTINRAVARRKFFEQHGFWTSY